MAAVADTLESLGLVIYDGTMSLCGLVVRVLTQNVRGIKFNPHVGLYTFHLYFWGVQKSKSVYFQCICLIIHYFSNLLLSVYYWYTSNHIITCLSTWLFILNIKNIHNDMFYCLSVVISSEHTVLLKVKGLIINVGKNKEKLIWDFSVVS